MKINKGLVTVDNIDSIIENELFLLPKKIKKEIAIHYIKCISKSVIFAYESELRRIEYELNKRKRKPIPKPRMNAFHRHLVAMIEKKKAES